jgi:hypothetical protein
LKETEHKHYFLLALLFCFLNLNQAWSQGEGPMSYLLAPKDLTAFSPIYINLSTNTSPSNDVVLAVGDIDIDAYVLPIVHPSL